MKKGRNEFNLSFPRWFLFLFAGWALPTVGFLIAISVAQHLMDMGAPDWLWKFTQAILFTIFVLIIMILFQKSLSINIWSFIKLKSFKKSYYYFILGIFIPIFLVTIGAVIAHISGIISLQGFNFSLEIFYIIFLNSIIAFLYEAFPEEVFLRGYIYSTLRLRFGRFWSVIFQITMFALFPVGLTWLQPLFGINTMKITPDYIVLIFTFGLSLQFMRLLTDNLWTSIGFHLAYLEIARFVVPQGEHGYVEGLSSILIYDEVETGVGAVFLLMFMIILGSIVVGGIVLYIMKRKGKFNHKTSPNNFMR